MYTLDTSWTYIIVAVGITIYSFYNGIKEKQRRAKMEDVDSEVFNNEDLSLDNEYLEDVNFIEQRKEQKKNSVVERHINNNMFNNRINDSIESLENNPIVDITKEEKKNNINTFKDRVKKNPKDLILFSEILKPKYLDF